MADRAFFYDSRRAVDAAADPRSPFTTSDAVGICQPALRGRRLDATVHVIADAGHLLLMDHAPECAELITPFLRNGDPDM
jgi:hypothetical protein